jgi:phenylalanyl-tRNA synthetase beta subunit
MSDARTLVDDEVDRVVGTIIGAAEKALGASVRQ